jgi:hypothetical protein
MGRLALLIMKAKERGSNLTGRVRQAFRRRARRHDPMLVLSMSIFNFTNGWNRTFSKYEYARFYS